MIPSLCKPRQKPTVTHGVDTHTVENTGVRTGTRGPVGSPEAGLR